MPINAYAAKGPKQKLEPLTYDPGPLAPQEASRPSVPPCPSA
jgi:hypothetical protein